MKYRFHTHTFIPTLILLAALIGAMLARRALAPIGAITQTANSISRTKDLGQRMNIPNDVSEVGQLAATFNNMLDRIQMLFRTQERLVADVSHELRTPLTTVQGNIQLLRRMMTAVPATAGAPVQDRVNLDNEMVQEVLNEVESETARMNKMINDLLLLAQADSGAVQLQWAPVEMDTLLLDVYRQAKRVAELRKGGNALDIRLGSEDQGIVWGDRERLRQVLLNLADNAIKYTPEGGEIKIRLTPDAEAEYITISVVDNGIGITEKDQAHLFRSFFRGSNTHETRATGAGLGLNITRSLVHLGGNNHTILR